MLSDDVYRYIWDGRVQRFGYDPYATTPNDPALQHLHTDLTRRIDPTSAVLPTIYPPAAELLFRAVTSASESITAWIAVTLLCDALITVILWRWLVRTGRTPWWVLAYAWHPLVAIEGAGAGHIDLVGTLFVSAAAYALVSRRTAMAAVALACGFVVKFLPIVLVPLLWRRVRMRDLLLATSVVLVCYAAFASAGRGISFGSLGVYINQWRFNGPLFGWLVTWVAPAYALGLATVAGLAMAAWMRRSRPIEAADAWAWPMAAAIVLMPAVYPWYLVWLTPFLQSRWCLPLLAWTLVSLLTYTVWPVYLAGAGWVLPGWVAPLEYGSIIGVTLLLVAQNRAAGS